MEYYNTYTSSYLEVLKQTRRVYKIKVEILDHWEKVIAEITRFISETDKGQININYQQGTRCSCDLTLSDVNKQFLPSENSWFWYNRKFKLYIGIVNTRNHDVYWWSKGVYITTEASCEQRTVHITGTDKFAIWDGTLGSAMTDVSIQYPVGTTIRQAIQDTLMLDMGNGKPLDPIEPHIDMGYNLYLTQQDLVIDSNAYIGEFFTELASSYSADVYYDFDGNFCFEKLYNDVRVSGYRFLAPQWEYDFRKSFYCNPNVTYDFSGKNVVTVSTNATKIENVSHTSYNYNPHSPLRVDAIGNRMMENQELTYVFCTPKIMEYRCKQYADYLLLQTTMSGATINFNSPIIPHIDVNKTISITDKYFNYEKQLFVIQSLTIPLGAGEMSVSACNITWLPDDTELGKVTSVRRY